MHQCNGKVYSRTGKSKRYPNIEEAYNNGVGHPNCKCEFSIFWDKSQLENQYIAETQEGEYEEDQKKKAVEREMRKTRQDKELYEMIGNYDEVDKCNQKLERLRAKL